MRAVSAAASAVRHTAMALSEALAHRRDHRGARLRYRVARRPASRGRRLRPRRSGRQRRGHPADTGGHPQHPPRRRLRRRTDLRPVPTSCTPIEARVELSFKGTPPGDRSIGGRVRVHGVAAGRTLLVADGGTETLASASTSTSSATGSKRVAIVLVNFSNDASQPYTPEYAGGVAFNNTNSVAAYYAASSYGQLTLAGDVFGWYTVPETNATCATDTWASSAASVAAAAGVTLSAYDNIVYAFPTVSSCGWAGLAQMPGNLSWLNGIGAMNLRVMAHELGHNFGTHHASTLSCTVGGVRVSLAASAADCSTSEYGDPFTVMGQASQYEHTNYSRGNFGWLQSSDTLTVTTTGDYALQATETTGTGVVRALRMARTSSSFFTLELRRPSGLFDAFATTAPAVTGVSVRITSGYSVPLQSQLVDASPATTSFLDAPLAAGQTLVDPLSRISITTVSMSASGATVHVDIRRRAVAQRPHPRRRRRLRRRRRPRLPRRPSRRLRRHRPRRLRRHRPWAPTRSHPPARRAWR